MLLYVNFDTRMKHMEMIPLTFFGPNPLKYNKFLALVGVDLMNEFKRAHQRYSLASVDAVVAGEMCPVINVSTGGILIENWKKPPDIGTSGAFKIRAPMDGSVKSIDITGTVIRIQDDGSVALSFSSPGHDWPKLLEFLDQKEREEDRLGDD